MNGVIITVIMLGSIALGVAAVDKCKPLWKWIEKQQWWKEIMELAED